MDSGGWSVPGRMWRSSIDEVIPSLSVPLSWSRGAASPGFYSQPMRFPASSLLTRRGAELHYVKNSTCDTKNMVSTKG